jgi:hypothetical protein
MTLLPPITSGINMKKVKIACLLVCLLLFAVGARAQNKARMLADVTRVNPERAQAVVAGVVLPLEQLIPCKKTTAPATARLPPPAILEVLSTFYMRDVMVCRSQIVARRVRKGGNCDERSGGCSAENKFNELARIGQGTAHLYVMFCRCSVQWDERDRCRHGTGGRCNNRWV